MIIATSDTECVTPMQGHVHAIETCGTVDEPGIRFVAFVAGCPLRCLYCANPDRQSTENSKLISVDELITEIQKTRSILPAASAVADV
ncbi:MAG: 4Fe-4S cluster-binding domain-containing protein [Stenomitos frigidus ULC029]